MAKSNKQRRKELDEARVKKHAKQEERVIDESAQRGVAVLPGNLAPYNSYGTPDFVARGYYIDKTFECTDCGEQQVWTAKQQKRWYEVAKGQVYSTAVRCRACRRKRKGLPTDGEAG